MLHALQRIVLEASADGALGGSCAPGVQVIVEPSQYEAAVADLEAWDRLNFTGFGYDSAEDVFRHLTQTKWGVLFSDQGTTVLLADTAVAQITADMFGW